MSDWTKTLFNQSYVATEGLALSQALTKKECAVLVRVLGLEANQQILDLACGHGRHSIELARQGFSHILGLDFNRAAIEQARRDAQSSSAQFVVGDMLQLEYTEQFDVVLSLFHSMFYWDDTTHLAILRGVYRALKPGGRLLLDSYNPFALVHRKLLEQHPVFGRLLAWRKRLGRLYRQLRQTHAWHETQSHFVPSTGRIQGIKRMYVGKNCEEHPLDVRIYSCTELERLLHEAGFGIEKIVSSAGTEFTAQSPRFLLVAKKQ
ncbi:MAG: class I SAM-dependent methyltransferase [Deinococcales bacterium]